LAEELKKPDPKRPQGRPVGSTATDAEQLLADIQREALELKANGRQRSQVTANVVAHDPLVVKYKGLHLFVDLAAEKTLSVEQREERIAVEVKVFGGLSLVTDFEKAIGQYSPYRGMLRRTNSDRELYLAITQKTFVEFFLKPAINEFVFDAEIHLLIFNPETQEIIEWHR